MGFAQNMFAFEFARVFFNCLSIEKCYPHFLRKKLRQWLHLRKIVRFDADLEF